jgi:uncharacterized protein
MLIQQQDYGEKGSFFVKEGDELLAEMTYTWPSAHLFIIDHTEVSDKLAGKGVGKKLVNAAIEFARTNEHKILPLCSFAKKVIDKDPAYQDVLHKASNP